MGAVIAVVSGKGGAGKTCLVGGVASCLAAMGRRVLCLDTDAGLRNLDLVLGLGDRVMMDFSDVVEGRCSLEDAFIPHPDIPGLFLLSAPQRGNLPEHVLAGLVPLVKETRCQFDDILLDCPAGLGPGVRVAVQCAERAVVVTGIDPVSLRDAQQTVSLLGDLNVAERHLVINRVQARIVRKMKTNLDDVMDTVSLPLLGVVPEDEQVTLAVSSGKPLVLAAGGGRAATAYLHIAQRLTGMRVPLMRIR
ncbi:MAG: AAA family ATPase [Oscillospiraceae bacterium]|nr:AAA family ATPase [Oscillospiraceae bacterium]